MKIIIVGCGKIGESIIQNLISEGHEVVAVDSNPEIATEIANVYDAMCVVGNGVDSDILLEAGASEAELLVAVTGSDEFNMLCCFLARKLGTKHTIARIRNPEYNDKSLNFMKKQLNLSLSLNPDFLAAHELYNILRFPSAVNVETFCKRQFELIEIKLKPESVLDGMTLHEIRKQYDAKFLVCTVQRDEQVFIPRGNFVMKSGDRIHIAAEQAEIEKLFRMLGIMQEHSRSVIILGASRIAFYLAKKLIASGVKVKIIEQDISRCEQFSNYLPKATIIHGDGAKQELLSEEGLRDTDAFITLTGMDEQNILISYYAQSQGVPKVITKVNRPELAFLSENMGLDTVISPKKMVSDVLTRYARALENSMGSSVETLYKITDGKAEALEFIVENEFKFGNIPIKELKIKKNILVAGIIRDRAIIIPSGDDYILPNDHVIIIAQGIRLVNLADIIEE